MKYNPRRMHLPQGAIGAAADSNLKFETVATEARSHYASTLDA